MDKKKCPILKIPKKFCEFFCCFFDVTEKREYNYYFGDVYIYGDKTRTCRFSHFFNNHLFCNFSDYLVFVFLSIPWYTTHGFHDNQIVFVRFFGV